MNEISELKNQIEKLKKSNRWFNYNSGVTPMSAIEFKALSKQIDHSVEPMHLNKIEPRDNYKQHGFSEISHNGSMNQRFVFLYLS